MKKVILIETGINLKSPKEYVIPVSRGIGSGNDGQKTLRDDEL